MARTHVAQKKKSTKKLAAGITAGVLSAALLVGGVFAWRDFQQNATNIFHSTAMNDVLLHDDFTPGENKDVYVENTGDSPLYVRVQFAEFLQVGNNVIMGNALKQTDSYVVHTYDGPLVQDPLNQDYDSICHDLNEDGTLGDVRDSHNYYRWDMSGSKKIYLPNVSEQGDIVWEKTDLLGGNGQYTQWTQDGTPIIMMSEYAALKAEIDAYEAALAAYEADTTGTVVAPAALSEDAQNVVDGCWILDDSKGVDEDGKTVNTGNGWAYWSVMLQPNTATNLLLDNVTKVVAPEDNAVYAIDVRLQATNETELSEFLKTEDMSDEAKELFPVPEVTSVEINTGNATVFIYNTKGSTAQLNTVVTGINNSQNVIYEIENVANNNVLRSIIGQNTATGIEIDGNGLLTMTKNMEVGGTYKVTAYAQQDVSVFDDIIVKVVATPASSGDGSTGGADETIKTVVNPDGEATIIAKDEDGTWKDENDNEVIPTVDDKTYTNTGEVDDEGNEIWSNPDGEPVIVEEIGDKLWVNNEDGTYTDPLSGITVEPAASETDPAAEGGTYVPDDTKPGAISKVKVFVSSPRYVLELDKSYNLELSFLDPADASLKRTYYSSNPAAISVDANGTITTHSISGNNDERLSANIIVVLEDGSKAACSLSAYAYSQIRPLARLITNNYTASTDKPIVVAASGSDATGAGATGAVTNVTYKYEIVDAAGTGATVTEEGWFAPGTAGTVTLKATATQEGGITISETFTVTVLADLSAEDKANYITSTNATTTWASLEAAPEFDSGTGTKADPYIIKSLRQLKKITYDMTMAEAAATATYGKYYRLEADFDFAGDTSITGSLVNGTFCGTFDGNNKKFTNLNIANSTATGGNYGIFAGLQYGEIKDLTLESGSINVPNAARASSIVGIVVNAKVTNCHNKANISASSGAGGIAGSMAGASTMEGCTNSGNITVTNHTGGGIIGAITTNYTNKTVLKDCVNTGTVSTSTNGAIGGLVGYFSVNNQAGAAVEITNCKNEGEIRANNAGSNQHGALFGVITAWTPMPQPSFTVRGCESVKGCVFTNNAAVADRFYASHPDMVNRFGILLLASNSTEADGQLVWVD